MLKLIPLASDSLGVRSMALLVDLKNLRILVDAGSSLGPRYGLPPHPIEYKALKDSKIRIRRAARKADIVFISHYHFDHYTPCWPNIEWKWTWAGLELAKKIYSGKEIWAKSPETNINYSQRFRALKFFNVSKEISREVKFLNGERLLLENIEFEFIPLKHGSEDSKLGYVLALNIDNELLFLSDVQGPGTEEAFNLIKRIEPRICVLSGPPIYLVNKSVSEKEVAMSFYRLKKVVEYSKITIIDHHIMRSENYGTYIDEVRREARRYGHLVYTYAELLGKENTPLESKRKELYEKYPPDEEFMKWASLPPRLQSSQPPPL